MYLMNIAIDARFYGSEHTGLGRYTTNVLKFLPQHLQGKSLKVLLRQQYFDTLKLPKNCEKVLCDIPHYSLTEQIKLPLLLRQLSPDLYYTFHFNVPLLSSVPTIITVHDLIKSHFTGSDTTTRSPWLYQLKRAGYNQVIQRALVRARDIIVPSNTVKNDILAAFPMVLPELIHPIPEAPDEIFRQNLKLENFVIVAKQTPFLSRVLAPFDQTRIHVLSDLTDQELVAVYHQARALVTPSLMEGYGLVGLEALMVGTPVIASNIPVYREVYGHKVTYFDPHSLSSLVGALVNPQSYILNQTFNFDRTWDNVAQSIAEVIDACCTSL
ncbi:MAG: glycosyl transferase, group 1 [Microgenomates group bacterium GW2011_GWA2_46_7]|nr:MAG: glycosyl transferase, group 1 [Microgenomates group bacterium GW2011_GWA2_46_7]